MELKTVLTCPLGSKCEEIKDGAIHRCMWFTKMAGSDPATGKEIETSNCAMSWLPLLLVENSREQLKTGAAVESFRNEMVKAQETSQQILIAAALSKPQTLKYLEEQ
jgi:hypothetical protein